MTALTRQKLLQALPDVERYGAAILAVVCTLAIRLLLDPILAERAPYMLFILAVVVVVRLWGRGPALLVTLLGGIASWYFLLEPRFSFNVTNPFDAANLAAFFIVGTAISFIGEGRVPGVISGAGRNIKLVRQSMVLGSATVVLVGMVLLLLHDFQRAQVAEGWVVHTYEVINAAESIRSTMDDANTGARRFLQTGDARDLSYYDAAVAALPRNLKVLKDLTSDNASQQARWAEIKRLSDERLSTLQHALVLRASVGLDAALSAFRSSEALQPLDNLRFALDHTISEERQLLRARTAEAEIRASRGRWVLGLGSTALILLLVFASAVIEGETARREEITKALRHHASLLEQAHDSLLTCRLGGIDFWSHGAETLYGFSREEALGHPSHELLHTAHPLGIAQIDALLEHDGHWKGELTQTTKDGRKLVVESHWTLAVDDRGNKTVLEANRDITDRKRAEASLRQSEERLRSVLDGSQDVIYRLNVRSGRYEYISPACQSVVGFSPDELQAQDRESSFAMVHPDDLPAFRSAVESLEAAGTSHLELEYRQRTKNGAYRWLSNQMSLVRDSGGKPLYRDGCIRDITDRKRAEEALRQSESRERARAAEFEALMEAAPVGIFRSDDSECRQMTGNRAAYDLLRRPRGSNLSKSGPEDEKPLNFRAIKDGKEVPLAELPMQKAAATGQAIRDSEMDFLFEDGVTVNILGHAVPLLDESGRTRGVVGVFADITGRKRGEKALQESELRYRQLFERSESALALHEMIFDAQGTPQDYRFLDVNPAFEHITGLSRQKVLGHTALEMLPNLEDYWIKLYGRVASTGESAAFENYTSSLGRYYAGSAYSPRPNQFAVSFMDVTERKRAEEEVRQLNIELEARVRSRTAALEAANRELEAFAHSVSHDLRAPLRGIDGWSKALLDDYGQRLDAQAQKYLDRVRSEAQRMGRLIDDLLHLSRVSRTELVFGPVDLTALAEAAIARLRDANPGRCIEFIVARDLRCFGDARLLEIALTNLLNNAVKFTAPRTSARIEFGITESDGHPAFFLRDNGAGFDMAYAGMLFAPFQRLHKTSEFPGSGIGLATVQRVILRHGGRIWAEAQVGAGATFYFTFGANKS